MPPARAVAALALLCAIYVCGQWARYSLAYLSSVAIDGCTEVCKGSALPLCPEQANGATPECVKCYAEERAAHLNLRQGTCVNEAQYGLLVSYGFITLFATAGLFAGRLSDRLSRRDMLAASAVGAGLSALLQSYAGDFQVLLLSRVAMGFFTAFCAPASYSLLADIFPAESLGTVNGLFSWGVYVGGGLSSLTILMARRMGWRWASRVIAITTMVASAGLLLLVSEPVRLHTATKAPPKTLRHTLKLIWNDKVVVLVFVAAALRFFGGFALGAYLAPFFKRRYPDKNDEFSILNAFVVSVAGAVSSIAGGWISDAWCRRDVRAKGWVPGVGALLALPLLYVFLENDVSFEVAMTLLFFAYLFAECWFGPALSIIQARVEAPSRGFAISVYLFVGSMLGNASPVVIAALDDGASSDKLGSLIFACACFSYVSCSLVFALASLGLDRPAPPIPSEDEAPLLSSSSVGGYNALVEGGES